ncbi:MAG: HEAT repeat domain-containing protein [Phycisphaerae bacterium]|nr:HEAT repeat domain-containing protein [Phycisphaerae bacterium]
MQGAKRWAMPAVIFWAALAAAQQNAVPTPVVDIRRQMQPFVRQAVFAESPLAAEHAAGVLRDAHAAYLSVLTRCGTRRDAEVRTRAKDVLDRAVLAARLRRIEAILSEDLAKKFAAFRRRYPQQTADIFSRDLQQQVEVLKHIEEQKDPQGLAEPILVICLKHPSEELRAWAATAGAKRHYRSDMFADALCDVLDREISFRGASAPYMVYLVEGAEDDPPNVLQVAFDALRVIRPPRARQRLLAILDKRRNYEMDLRLCLAEAIGMLRDPTLIPLLLRRLPRRARANYTRSLDGRRVTFAVGDDALLALLRLTRQSPSQYDLILETGQHGTFLGFADNSQRAKAYEKFKAWWEANRNRKEFQVSPAASRPASAPAESKPSPPAPFPTQQDAERLKKTVAAEAQRLARGFTEEHYRRRAAASEELLALQDAMLAEVLTGARTDPPAQRRARLGLAEDMLVSARIEQFLLDRSPADRPTFRSLRADYPRAFRDYFGLSSSRRRQALESLTKDDATARTEPLVLDMLQNLDDETTPIAIQALGTGWYRSGPIQKLLAGPISDRYVQKLKREHCYYAMGAANPYQPWINALAAVGGEECFGVLRSILEDQDWQMRQRCGDVVNAIAESKDPRAVDMLLPLLEKTDILNSMQFSDKKKITQATSDYALMALIRVTGQDPKGYPFSHAPGRRFGGADLFGFPDEATRKKAIAQFRDWQDAQKTPTTNTAK